MGENAYGRHFKYKSTELGANTKGHDFIVYGDTTAKKIFWDASANTFYVVGTLSHTGALSVSSDFAINTNKFTVTASSGNTLVAGTLSVTGDVAINTNKFTVTAASGNTLVAGTLSVTGDVAINTNKFNVTASSGNTTISGTLGVTGDVAINTNKFAVTASSGATTVAGLITAQAGIKLTASASTTEGVVWYDSAAHVLKYYDNVGAKTITAT